VPVKEERTRTWKVNVPYTEQVEQTYTVMVPVKRSAPPPTR